MLAAKGISKRLSPKLEEDQGPNPGNPRPLLARASFIKENGVLRYKGPGNEGFSPSSSPTNLPQPGQAASGQVALRKKKKKTTLRRAPETVGYGVFKPVSRRSAVRLPDEVPLLGDLTSYDDPPNIRKKRVLWPGRLAGLGQNAFSKLQRKKPSERSDGPRDPLPATYGVGPSVSNGPIFLYSENWGMGRASRRLEWWSWLAAGTGGLGEGAVAGP